MSLDVVWFVVVAVFWTGFFVLEGFDFGVGMLHGAVGRTDHERAAAIRSIGPLWDGNEVWLIVAGAAIFAAFPDWYATWFSAGYLALLLVIVALIFRGVSFEWGARVDGRRWRRAWAWALTAGSAVVPLLLGVAVGDLLAGLPIDASGEFTGSFVDLLTPYGLAVGVTLTVLCVVHGATFLALKTSGPVRDRSRRIASRSAWGAAVLVVVVSWWTISISPGGPWRVLAAVVPVAGAVASIAALRQDSDGRSFAATAVAIGGVVAAIFANLYPQAIVSSTSAANSIGVADAASGDYALKVMTIVAVVVFPVVLLYQGWSYWVFRRRVASAPSPGAGSPGGGAA